MATPKTTSDEPRQPRLFDHAIELDVRRHRGGLVRVLRAGRFVGTSTITRSNLGSELSRMAPRKAWQLAELRGALPRVQDDLFTERVAVVDLFCGCGGFTTGIRAAARALGIQTEVLAAADFDPHALAVYRANHGPRHALLKNIDSCVDFGLERIRQSWRFAYPPSVIDSTLQQQHGKATIVIGGPPCQGHSNFNNLTRRADPRNALYLTVPAIGVALEAPVILIENVPSVVNDTTNVVDRTLDVLRDAGYVCDTVVLEGDTVGTAQQRKRHFLLATRSSGAIPLSQIADCLSAPQLTAWDAIRDLARRCKKPCADLFDTPAELSTENQDRVNYLFDHEAFDLPDHVRPECHKEGHTYPSVYGRIHPDRPAQTLTGGFMSPGRGRFVHPMQRRGLTPHEGARLQGFPDHFVFRTVDGIELHRKDFAKMIGDAVPPPMAFAMAIAAFSSL